jgi:hypothetical protein
MEFFGKVRTTEIASISTFEDIFHKNREISILMMKKKQQG